MDIEIVMKVFAILGTIGANVFAIGTLYGKLKEQQKVFSDKISKLEERVEFLDKWQREHSESHKEQELKIADRIAQIDKNVQVLLATFEILKDDIQKRK